MTQVFAHYVVHENMVAENEKLIAEIFNELDNSNLNGVKYEVYKMGTNVFVHISLFKDELSNNLFFRLKSFGAFQTTLKRRLAERPIVNEVSQIGCYPKVNLH